jgi:hypothetical protein
MRSCLYGLLFLICPSITLYAAEAPAHYQIYGGYTWLSNSFNGFEGARQPLNGWDRQSASLPGVACGSNSMCTGTAEPAWARRKTRFSSWPVVNTSIGSKE